MAKVTCRVAVGLVSSTTQPQRIGCVLSSELDANHEDNVNAGSFKWYLPAFSVGHGNKNYNTDVDYYCHPRPVSFADDVHNRACSPLTQR